ncbi:BON domain-containing protein [Paraburkholderia pallida]|uniref:BON domain-containing protein n=1 Tax=Paraburkholderia pallida TaxID=2547399 RepID=A0A4P7D4X7_9BURK|nr:BON domain-containing protein [Paraburkholderia pallida]QBR01940.1 BON domain-containing protein [Paraburkholderia pallida]
MQIIKYFSAIIATTVLLAAPVYAQQASDATPPATAATKKALHKQNWQTENAVHKALSRTKGLDAANIVVVARNGAVTLDGTVPDASQIQLAQDTAQGVPRVKSVANALSVKEAGN